MTCIKTGAIVHFVDYGQVLSADLFEVSNAIVIRTAPGSNLDQGDGFDIDKSRATHEVRSTNGIQEFWRTDLNIFVVSRHQIKFLE